MAVSYQVIVTPEARDQIHAIVDYWDEHHSYEKATGTLTAILEAIDSLSEMPSRYPPVPSVSVRGAIYR